LQRAVERARVLEAGASQRAAGCAANHARIAAERAAAQAARDAGTAALEGAAARVAAAEALLLERRQKLEGSTAAISEATERARAAIAEDDAARMEASQSVRLLHERSSARRKREEELRAILERFRFAPAAPAAPKVEQQSNSSGRRPASVRRRGGVGLALVGVGFVLAAISALAFSLSRGTLVGVNRASSVAAAAARPAAGALRHPRVVHVARHGRKPARIAARPHLDVASVPVAQVERLAPPRILMLSMLPRKVTAGGTATLCVSAAHAKRLFVSGVGAFNPGLTTCRTFAPARTSNFVAYAVNAGGQRTKRTISVVVDRGAMVAEFHPAIRVGRFQRSNGRVVNLK
jgi:hypothetical protein